MNYSCSPTSPLCSPQMESLVKNPLASPVKCFQLRDKSGLYHFHLVVVNVIFLWGTFCKLWPWLFCSCCFQTCHVLHLSKPGNMSEPNYGLCEEQSNQLSSSLLFPKIDLSRRMHITWWLFAWSGELTAKPGAEEVACGCYSSAARLFRDWPKEVGEGYLMFCPTSFNQACFDLWFFLRLLSCSTCRHFCTQTQFLWLM